MTQVHHDSLRDSRVRTEGKVHMPKMQLLLQTKRLCGSQLLRRK